MPIGKATIIDDSGLIATSPPTPVSFIASRFPSVRSGMTVYYERSGEPTIAKLVRPASAGDQLASLAAPSIGLTPMARSLVAETAESRSAHIAHKAGRAIDDLSAFEEQIAVMTNLRTKLETVDGRVGIAAVRTALL
jgi:hypothetical protein